jgi:hypothetical protein
MISQRLVMLNLATVLLILGLQLWPRSAAAETAIQLPTVINAPGAYRSANGQCPISVEASDMGGFLQLFLPPKSKQIRAIDDISGVAYVNERVLAYTVSPIYGKPGVYLYDCSSRVIKRIVKPTRIDTAYPDGKDYFELQGFEGNKIYFYYAPDVDVIDFKNFRTTDALYEVLIDGSALGKHHQE